MTTADEDFPIQLGPALVAFVATPETINLEVEIGTNGTRVKFDVVAAVQLLRQLREEIAEHKRLAKRAERRAARAVKP